MKRVVAVDFETGPIRARPDYPPVPVGVAILDGKKKPKYLAWAHPTENNCTKAQATAELRDLWRDPDVELLFHNAKFDTDVAETHLKLALPPWQRWHDSMFLIYLDDPRAASLSLKPSAERILGLPPVERDAVRDWLVDQGICKRNAGDWGAAIGLAPGGLVGAYAIGDVERTRALYDRLLPRIDARGMREAYDRERRLMPMLLENERRGIRVDLVRLTTDVREYARDFERVEVWLRKALGAPDLDFDKDAQLAAALDASGQVTDWVATATGKRSTSMKNLVIADPRIRDALIYRAKLATNLRTFMGPWLETARQTDGTIYTSWNQVRGDNDKGTRTGRFSSNPNFQNIPTEAKPLKLPVRVAPLPLVRRYIVGDTPKHSIVSLDYASQELRILGHFEDGPLLAAFQTNPRLDVHEHARQLINKMLNTKYERKPIKNMSFGLLYGMGLGKMADSMDIDVDAARTVKRAYLAIFPGLKRLIDGLTQRARLGLPIRTWGGREYFVEPPRMIDNQMRSFEYKMLNYLIQGSSADCTKEAMCRYAETQCDGRFMLQVHDQLVISVPHSKVKSETKILRAAMESIEVDVSMLTDTSIGLNLGELKPI